MRMTAATKVPRHIEVGTMGHAPMDQADLLLKNFQNITFHTLFLVCRGAAVPISCVAAHLRLGTTVVFGKHLTIPNVLRQILMMGLTKLLMLSLNFRIHTM